MRLQYSAIVSIALSVLSLTSIYGQQEPQNKNCQAGEERIDYRYKYRYCYPRGCRPRELYYTKEYGVQRHAHWPGRIYEPFHESLTR